MDVEILCRPAASVAKLSLEAGERVTCEVGGMIAMSPDLQVQTAARQKGGGGLWAGVKRVMAGENFFLNEFTATRSGQTLYVGPSLSGDVVHHKLRGGNLVVQGSSWLASGPGVTIDATFQGLSKALFAGESVFWVKCSGSGDLLLSSFGAIYEVEVNGKYVVDTGHIVAFDDTLRFSLGKLGDSWLGSFLSGEGVVCHFEGHGRLYCQSHNPPAFGKLLGPMLTPRS